MADLWVRGRVSHLSAVAPLERATVVIRVIDAAGEVVHQANRALEAMALGGQRALGFDYAFDAAAEGAYRVRGEVVDENGSVMASAEAGYVVEELLVRALSASVVPRSGILDRGARQRCTHTLVYEGSASHATVTVERLLVAYATGEALVTERDTVELSPGVLWSGISEIDTANHDPGDFACILRVEALGEMVPLASAGYRLRVPPVNIESALGEGSHGRLLVLLDPPSSSSCAGEAGRIEEGDGELGPGNGARCDDPLGPLETVPLPAQRTALEERLSADGWSYTVVTDADTFVRECRSGAYSLYLLASETVHLPVAAQKGLREAVYRGEGLVVAGDHDRRNAFLDKPLGVAVSGVAERDGVVLTGEDGYPFVGPRRVVRVRDAEGVVLARFAPGGEPAMTHRIYGRGKAVYIAFDLLAEATAAAESDRPVLSTPWGELLVGALAEVSPEGVSPMADGVLPMRLTLVNQGIATPGVATLALPAGVGVLDAGAATVEEAALRWPFDLAEAQSATFDAWLRLPPAGGPLTLTAAIETGTEADLVPYDTVEWSLAVPSPATVEEAQGLLPTAGLPRNQQVRVTRDLADAATAEAGGDREAALAALLQAADVLLAADPAADPLRLAIARAAASLWRTP